VSRDAADQKFDDRAPIIHHLAVSFDSRLYRNVSVGMSPVSVVKITNKTTGEAFMPLDLFLLDTKRYHLSVPTAYATRGIGMVRAKVRHRTGAEWGRL